MSTNPAGSPTFTRLHARIVQEENVFTLTVRLSDPSRLGEGAWGEEIAPSIHSASRMIDAIAEKFGISEKNISINIVMDGRDETFH